MSSLLLRGLVAAALAVGGLGCAAEEATDDDAALETAATGRERRDAPADPRATEATRTVLANLHAFDLGGVDPFDRRVLVGQQEFDTSNRRTNGLAVTTSDFAAVAGKAPALVSYELSQLDKGAMTPFDAARFRANRATLRQRILDKHAKGILVSLVWHLRCPKTVANTADEFGPDDCPRDYNLEELRARKANDQPGAHFAEWRAMLDELAELLWSLKDERGELVPVQIRPFHEHTGAWFWWGRNNEPETYVAVWREMVTYLRDGRGLHNALWVYCPAAPSDRSTSGFERYYPGDAFVDVVSFDRYDLGNGSFARGYAADLRTIGDFAREHGKVAAVAEVGREMSRLPADPTWFTRGMLAPIAASGRKFAYVALWRNAPWEKFVPEAADGAGGDDFRSFTRDPRVLLGGVHNLYRPLHVSGS